jgi:hypothetical protein
MVMMGRLRQQKKGGQQSNNSTQRAPETEADVRSVGVKGELQDSHACMFRNGVCARMFCLEQVPARLPSSLGGSRRSTKPYTLLKAYF